MKENYLSFSQSLRIDNMFWRWLYFHSKLKSIDFSLSDLYEYSSTFHCYIIITSAQTQRNSSKAISLIYNRILRTSPVCSESVCKQTRQPFHQTCPCVFNKQHESCGIILFKEPYTFYSHIWKKSAFGLQRTEWGWEWCVCVCVKWVSVGQWE